LPRLYSECHHQESNSKAALITAILPICPLFEYSTSRKLTIAVRNAPDFGPTLPSNPRSAFSPFSLHLDSDKGYRGRKEKYETTRKSIQKKLEVKEDIAQKLADLILDRFAQDCKRCEELLQVCNFPENSHMCSSCTAGVLRCPGDADWDDLDLMWHATDPIHQQVDEFLLNNLLEPTTFQRLRSDEANTWALLQPYSDRSDLSVQEQEESSRLSQERQQIRKSVERIRADSFCDDITYQELLSSREVLTICGNAASRWWSDYEVEQNERTGHPMQRGLPDVEDMTDTQYRDAVAWVQTHPFYKYDGSLSSSREAAIKQKQG
jgi:hypothetical protein